MVTRRWVALVVALVFAHGVANADEFVAEKPSTATLAPAHAHQLWLNDLAAFSYTKATLLDADSGGTLGAVDTGYLGMELELSAKAARLYSAETYFSRGFRGERSDVITEVDARTLLPVREIAIPAKRMLGVPTGAHSALLDDERFLVAYNFTPASTVSVVDLERGAFVGEIELAGCALVYPLDARRFAALCGAGGLLEIELDDRGGERRRKLHAGFFDPATDPLMEKAVRIGAEWLFVSFRGVVHPVEAAAELRFGKTWTLASDAERAAGWRPGGLQPYAAHAGTKRLFALMHKGGDGSHKDPGEVAWVFDVSQRAKVQTLELGRAQSSIAVSADAAPLLYGTLVGEPALHVYDARSGAHLRAIALAGAYPAFLQPVVAAR